MSSKRSSKKRVASSEASQPEAKRPTRSMLDRLGELPLSSARIKPVSAQNRVVLYLRDEEETHTFFVPLEDLKKKVLLLQMSKTMRFEAAVDASRVEQDARPVDEFVLNYVASNGNYNLGDAFYEWAKPFRVRRSAKHEFAALVTEPSYIITAEYDEANCWDTPGSAEADPDPETRSTSPAWDEDGNEIVRPPVVDPTDVDADLVDKLAMSKKALALKGRMM